MVCGPKWLPMIQFPCSIPPWAAEGAQPNLPPPGTSGEASQCSGMSLSKEDNKALEEIKVLSFWCECGGQTPSNPAPEGRSKAFKSLKPRVGLGSAGSCPRALQLLPAARLGGGGAVNPQIPQFPCFPISGVGWDGSKAVHLLQGSLSLWGFPEPHSESSTVPGNI